MVSGGDALIEIKLPPSQKLEVTLNGRDVTKIFHPHAAEYRVALSGPEMDELKQIFPAGVCDYSKPGVGQTADAKTWVIFSKGDGEYTTLP